MALALMCMVNSMVLDKELTMYHVNPLRFGPVPINTDAADAAGDLFFELFEVLTLPLQCEKKRKGHHLPFNCRNLEIGRPDDVVNKVTLRVNSNFSSYAMCNIGNASGMDPLGRPCPIGGYCCYCGHRHHWPPVVEPCNATIGMNEITSMRSHILSGKGPCHEDYECWAIHAGYKLTDATPGYWYSPLAYGDCDTHPAAGPNCTWAVKTVDKIVNASCHSDSFFGAVQRAAPQWFRACASGGGPAVPRPNTSDPCWVRGFYRAVLGPEAAKPKGWSIGGLPLDQILSYWTAPFESDDPAKGGCPGLPIPPRAEQRAMARARVVVEEKEWRHE